MKINRRKAGVFLLSGVVVAAAIAIPIGIVYGTSSDSTTKVTTFDYSTNTAKNKVNFAYGTPITTPTAPALDSDTGYTASKYNPGIYDKTTFNVANGVDGNNTATITYKYVPLNSSDPIVYVTYALNVSKGTPKDLSTFMPDPGTVQYGETELPKVNGDNDINAYLYAGGFGYRGTNSATNPKYVTSTGADFTAADLATLAVGETFKIQYVAAFDKANYVQDTTTHPDSNTFEFVYTIAKRTVAPPSLTSNPDAKTYYGVAYSFVAPAAADHYAAASTPVAVIKTRPATATADTPAEGAAVVPANVPKYEVGTVFTVTYTYTVAEPDKYDGPSYDFVTTTTVLAEAATRPTEANSSLPEKTFAFATAPAEFVSGSNTKQPDAPVYTGYVADATVVAKIKTASSVTTGNSPAADTDVVWTDVNSYNSGTKFEVVYSYTAAPNYTGDPFTVTQPYTITKAKVAIPTAVVNPTNTNGYNKGAELATIVAPAAFAHFTLTDTKYYEGTAVDASKVRTADQIKALTGGADFTVQWTYTLDSDNYEPASGTATTYTQTTPFKVVAANASYIDGSVVYSPATMEYSDALPANFVPTNLPEPSKNIGYKYKSVAYKVQKESTDKSTPAANQPAVIGDISKYGAGAEILATFTFAADSPAYKGADITATKVLTINKKAITKPANTDLPNVNLNYGATTAQPTTAPTPTNFAGFKGTYTSAAFTKKPTSGTGSGANDTFAWANFKDYAVGTVVTVTWTYTPDDNHTGSSFIATQTYTVSGKEAATALTPAETTLAAVNMAFGTKNLATTPTNPNESTYTAKGYVLDTTTAKILTQSPNTDTSNGFLRPAKDEAVTWPNTTVEHFNNGTVIRVTYTYKPDANHSGTPVTVTQDFTITLAPKTAAPTTLVLDAVSTKFGENTLSGPPSAPAPAAGYKLDTSATGTTTKVTGLGIASQKGSLQPTVNTAVVWADVKKYSPNTKFTVTYNYVNDSNHETSTYALTKEYTITLADQPAHHADVTLPALNIEFTKGPATLPAEPNLNNPDYAAFIYIDAEIKITAKSSEPERGVYKSPAKDAVIEWADVNNLNAGTKFTVTYTFKIDNNHVGAGTDPFYSVREYTVVPTARTAAAPTNLTAVNSVFGTATYSSLPENANKDKDEYEGLIPDGTPTALITTASTRKEYADHMSPAQGTAVSWPDVSKYNAGTVFTVTYKYKNDGNHNTAAYTVTQTYTITTDKTVTPPTTTPANPAVTTTVSYGTTTTTSDNTALPTVDTAAPALSNYPGAVGYDTGTVVGKPKVTKKSNLTLVQSLANSPANGTEIEWADLSKINAGTEFDITVTYAPTGAYSGAPFTVTTRWIIAPQKINVPVRDHTFYFTDMKAGGDPSGIFARATDTQINAGDTFDKNIFKMDFINYLKGNNPGDTNLIILTAAQVSQLPKGQKFMVQCYATIYQNYDNAATGGEHFNYRPWVDVT